MVQVSKRNDLLDTINVSQQELDMAIQFVNENLQEITYASETVSEETKDVLSRVSVLQTTIKQFQV